MVRAARSTSERAYQKDARIARLEAALQESEAKLHKYQSAAGELEGQCQDQAAEISDLQAQLDGALADEDQAGLSLVAWSLSCCPDCHLLLAVSNVDCHSTKSLRNLQTLSKRATTCTMQKRAACSLMGCCMLLSPANCRPPSRLVACCV